MAARGLDYGTARGLVGARRRVVHPNDGFVAALQEFGVSCAARRGALRGALGVLAAAEVRAGVWWCRVWVHPAREFDLPLQLLLLSRRGRCIYVDCCRLLDKERSRS